MSPLHFAATPRIAERLLAHGANINLRDRDHYGTPAQWTMRRLPEVCRYLLEQGAEADIVLYCAMGDVERAKAEFQKNPELLNLRINMKSPKGYVIPTLESPNLDSKQADEVPGGHVYAYQVGPTKPLLEMALNFKQGAIFDLLIDSGYEINFRDWYVLVGQGPKRFDTLVKGFLAKGWDINARQKHRHGLWTPLQQSNLILLMLPIFCYMSVISLKSLMNLGGNMRQMCFSISEPNLSDIAQMIQNGTVETQSNL